MNKAVIVENISYSVSDKKILSTEKPKRIMENISFSIPSNTLFGITGESGSGKTTLIKLLAKIYEPENGEIKYPFQIKENGISKIQLLFQNSEELINPVRKIKNQLKDVTKNDKKINEIFEILSLGQNLLSRRGIELSGGERQRVALAKLLLVKPQILICDEPFSAQDPVSKLNFVEIFKNINKKFGMTIICVSHEIDILKLFVENLLVLYGGKISETGNAKKIFEHPKHPYTEFLLKAAEYNIDQTEIFHPANDINTKEAACPYVNFCRVKSENCYSIVGKKEYGDRTVYCNNPLLFIDAKQVT